MNIIVLSPKNKTVFNFRGDLIKALIALGHRVTVVGPDREYVDDIFALGVSKFIEVPVVKDNTNVLGDLKYCAKLTQILKQEQYDLIFSYTSKPVIYGCIAGKRARIKAIYPMVTGIGRVFASHSIKARITRFILGRLYKKAFKSATKVIFQNNDDLNLFIKLGLLQREKAVRVDGSGVNLSRFHFVGLPAEPIFLMISRVIKEKGVFEFTEAASIVKKRYPQARFILLGGYDRSIGAIRPDELEPYIDSRIIEFPGEVKDVAPILSQTRFFVLPTYYFEGVPRTILEAMAMGLPVITTDWRGCRDAVIDGYNGFLVPPRDSETLAKKMIELIENPKLAETMGANSLKRCREVYDVNVVNVKMLEIFGLLPSKEEK